MSPDGGSGATELVYIALVAFVIVVVAGGTMRRRRRGSQTDPPGDR